MPLASQVIIKRYGFGPDGSTSVEDIPNTYSTGPENWVSPVDSPEGTNFYSLLGISDNEKNIIREQFTKDDGFLHQIKPFIWNSENYDTPGQWQSTLDRSLPNTDIPGLTPNQQIIFFENIKQFIIDIDRVGFTSQNVDFEHINEFYINLQRIILIFFCLAVEYNYTYNQSDCFFFAKLYFLLRKNEYEWLDAVILSVLISKKILLDMNLSNLSDNRYSRENYNIVVTDGIDPNVFYQSIIAFLYIKFIDSEASTLQAALQAVRPSTGDQTKNLLHENKKLIMDKFINDALTINSMYIRMQKNGHFGNTNNTDYEYFSKIIINILKENDITYIFALQAGYLSKYLTIKQYNEHRAQNPEIDTIVDNFIEYITNPVPNKNIYNYKFPEKKINEIYTYLKKLNYINIQAFSDALSQNYNIDPSSGIQTVDIDNFLTELSNKNIHFEEKFQKKRSIIYRGGKRKTIKRKNYRKRKTLKLRH